MDSKLHAVCDGYGKPSILLLTEGQVSDYRGAATVMQALPPDAMTMIVGRGYDSDRFRQAMSGLKISPAFLGARAARPRSPTTSKSTSSAIR
jgi:transposase